MSDVPIRVEGLGKRYRIGGPHEAYGTLRDLVAAAAKAPLRRVRGQHQERADIWALSDLSLEIHWGEVLGVIGGNGAGKSTLLKILSRITEPTTGRAVLRGRVGSLLEVGTGFHPELTGRENIYLNGALLGMSRRDIARHFDEIVEFAGIEPFLDTPVKRYSSGMYTRLAFSVAAHLEPEILIVDEVLAVGDAEFQRKSLGKMGDVARQGRTVLFVSHNMSAISQLCHRAIVLRHGVLTLAGKTDSAITAYLSSSRSSSDQAIFTSSEQHRDVALESARLIPESGAVIYGQPLSVTAVCRSAQPRKIAVELIIRDEYHHPVIFLPSGLRYGSEFDVSPTRRTTITCTIPVLPLAEGRYYVDILLALSGQAVLDRHEQCLAFTVVSSSPGSTSNSFTQTTGQGCVYLDARFEADPVND